MPWKEPPKKSYACNPELLVFLREKKGLTQGELAKAAGYSERLISKAESGQPISAETIEHLAQALSADDDPIHPEDLITDPVQLAKEYMTALHTQGSGTYNAIRHMLDEEIVFFLVGDHELLPFAGRHEGHAAVERAFELFFSILEAPKDCDYESHFTYLGQGNEVQLWGDSWIHPIGKPMDKPLRISHRFVFRRGKLVLFEDIYDTQTGIERLSEA